jgi:multidrug efflux system membrane fusion protein
MGDATIVGPASHTRGRNRSWTYLGWIVAAVAVGAAAFVAWRTFTKKPPARAAAPQTVQVAEATKGDMPVVLDELGTVTPTVTVTVMPNQAVSGYLTDVPFQEGQPVEKGQLLAQIDPRPYQAILDQTQGTLQRDQGILAEARMDLARYRKLVTQDSIARQQAEDQAFVVQQNEGTVRLDEAAVETAKLNLSYCRITSPIAGRIGLRLVDPGNYITGSSSTGIAAITSIKPTTVEFTVAQNDLGKVVERFRAPGVKLPVTATSSDNGKQLGTGTLYALNNQMTTSTGTVTLRASFPNDDEVLFPNEFVNVRLLVDTLKQAVLVPTAAVLSGAPGNYVYFVNRDNTVSVRKVTLGPGDGKNTVIASGLDAGDKVVTDGTDRLSEGAGIRIVTGTAQPAAAGASSGPRRPPGKADGGNAPSTGR